MFSSLVSLAFDLLLRELSRLCDVADEHDESKVLMVIDRSDVEVQITVLGIEDLEVPTDGAFGLHEGVPVEDAHPLRELPAHDEVAFKAEEAARRAMEHGVRKVDLMVKGPGSGRETAIRSIQNEGIEVVGIKDVTPIPHNGCRVTKRRRV